MAVSRTSLDSSARFVACAPEILQGTTRRVQDLSFPYSHSVMPRQDAPTNIVAIDFATDLVEMPIACSPCARIELLDEDKALPPTPHGELLPLYTPSVACQTCMERDRVQISGKSKRVYDRLGALS
jgi:hypothetical protein